LHSPPVCNENFPGATFLFLFLLLTHPEILLVRECFSLAENLASPSFFLSFVFLECVSVCVYV
jgi:hypothetical protein